MLNPRKLRRNDLVITRDTSKGFWPGRVWRRFDENHVVVVDCGKHVALYHEDDLMLSNYKGRWQWQRHPGNEYGHTPRWSHMTTLRVLKKEASRYNASFGGRRWTAAERAEAIANPERHEP